MAGRRRASSRPGQEAEIEVEVERLTNGPGALARAPDGRVIFLDRGLPGERVRVQVQEERRDFLRGRVVRELGGVSPYRRDAPCPVAGLCGGCPWQELADERQVAIKQEMILAELRRAHGVVPAEVLPALSADPWRSRHRIRLAVDRRGGEVRLGYRPRRRSEIVPISDCLVARPELIEALPLAERLAQAEPTVEEVELSVDDRGASRLRGRCSGRRPVSADRVAEQLGVAPAVEPTAGLLAGLALEGGAGRNVWRTESGDVEQRIDIGFGIELAVPVGSFTQVNLELNRVLVAEVCRLAGASVGRRYLDLYCGAGNFTLALAAGGAQVEALDGDPRAIEAGRKAAAAAGLSRRVRFTQRRLDATALDGLGEPFDVVVLDPPRAGAAALLPAIERLGASSLIYVSCDVATFGRDAATLVDMGARFESLRLVDLTPQTYRAELLGVFDLT